MVKRWMLAVCGCLAVARAAAQEDAERVYAQVQPSVVSLRNIEGSGTGIVIDGTGLILTNAHVVASPLPLQAHVEGYVGNTKRNLIFRKVQIVGVHPKYDLALVRIDPREHNASLKSVTLARVKGRPGQQVYAIGNPVAGEGIILTKTITAGMLSGVDRVIEDLPYYQISAPINPGNSGGPLCNREGHVLGLVTFKMMEAEGIGFAIPLDQFNLQAFVPFAKRPIDRKKALDLCKTAERYNEQAIAAFKRDGKDSPEGDFLNFLALRTYAMALTFSPNDPILYVNIGILCRGLGEPAVAVAYLTRALELAPWDDATGKYYRELAQALMQQKRPREAVAVWQEAAAKFPDAESLWDDLAVTWVNLGDFSNAAYAAQVCLTLKGRRADVMKKLHADAWGKLDEKARADLQAREARISEDLKTMKAGADRARAGRIPFIRDDCAAFIRDCGTLADQSAEVPKDLWPGGVPTTGAASPAPPTPPAEDEIAKWIKSKIESARLCQRHGLTEKARKHLQEIVDAHPDRPETAEARKLLAVWKGP